MYDILEQYDFYYSGDVSQVGPFMVVILDSNNRLRIYYIDPTYLKQVLAVLTSNVCSADNIANVILETQFLSDALFNQIISNLSIPGVIIVHRLPGFGGNYTYDFNEGWDTVGVYGE